MTSSSDLRDYVHDLPLVDVHEHHIPEKLVGSAVMLAGLFALIQD